MHDVEHDARDALDAVRAQVAARLELAQTHLRCVLGAQHFFKRPQALPVFAELASRAEAMVGRSSNNPPFLCAVLKDLGLIAPAPDKAHQHIKNGDWQAFREEWLLASGEQVMYPPVVVGATDPPATTVAA
jgi:hypothetical protein